MLTIRPATPDEAEILTALACAAKAYWGYSDEVLELFRADLGITPAFIAENTVLCAVDGAQVVGVAGVCVIEGGLELEHLWVAPQRTCTGVGSALLEAAVAHAGTAGVSRIRIVSDPNALGFYVRHGAKQVGQRDSILPGRYLPILELEVPAGSV